MTEVGPGDENEGKGQQSNMNMNRYATKKTIAQGMLDIALLTANASQLKYVLQVGKDRHPFYTLMVTLIGVSLALQVSVGISFLFIGALNINKPKSQRIADILNNLITIQIFIITVINVVISSFGIEHIVLEEEKFLRSEAKRLSSQGIVRRETPMLLETGNLHPLSLLPFNKSASGRVRFDERDI
ncbi:unnamed protein product [Orchesella dallaii]